MAHEQPRAGGPDALAVEDILDAMRRIGGYIDVSPSDALALYRLAYAHAAARLCRDRPVAEIMTRDVVTAGPGDTVLEAARMMARAGVSGLPVTDGPAVVGVLSIKDLLGLLGLDANARPAAMLVRLLDPDACRAPAVSGRGNTLVAGVMTAPALTVGPDTPRSEAAALMAERHVNRLPVLDAGGRLVGIVSRGDVVRSCRGALGGTDESAGCPA
uniref:CBS-domain-containing membrane protein n=1 Tax=Desulfovibrio sp. U5L TaxID=596152 RepID=I2Q5Z8_9BACT